jgi:erythromycin esterase-like protein
LRDELTKTDRLVDAFVEMAVTCARYEAYLKSVDSEALEKDRLRYDAAAKSGDPKGQAAVIAQKNLAIVMKRLDKLQEIGKYLAVAKGQLDLIENSFQLIADQIVTMQSPQQLSGQLDELLDGVEAIRETARDTEIVLGTNEAPTFP